MTLTKAVTELLSELQRPDLTEEEKKALEKYQHWLLGIKKTSTNSTDWHPYPSEKPPKAGYYLITHKGREVEIDAWSGEHWNYFPSSFVLAWAELPKPYKGLYMNEEEDTIFDPCLYCMHREACSDTNDGSCHTYEIEGKIVEAKHE